MSLAPRNLSGLLVAVILVSSGCGSDDALEVEPTTSSGAVSAQPDERDGPLDADRLIALLEATGAEVRVLPDELLDDLFRSDRTFEICVDQHTLAIHEYASEQDRQAASALLDASGQVPHADIHYYGPPRFHAAGSVMVLYQEHDPDFEILLAELMGETLTPLLGGEPPEEPVNPECTT